MSKLTPHQTTFNKYLTPTTYVQKAYDELVAHLAPFPLLSDVQEAIEDALMRIHSRNGIQSAPDFIGPRWRVTMSHQCRMTKREAVVWQAALILHGTRQIHTSSQTKLDKASKERSGFVNRGLTMATAREASAYVQGDWNACRGATPACVFGCVGSQTGQGRLSSSEIARVGRTLAMLANLDVFLTLLNREIERLWMSAARKGALLAFRANVAQDCAELAGYLAQRHSSTVDFYDYTAITSNMRRDDFVRRVYSRKDGRTALTLKMLAQGHGVCVVFDVPDKARDEDGNKLPLPATWEGYDVIDGDIDDLWFTRAPKKGPFVVGLRVKATTQEQLSEAIASDFAVAA
ncbi:MAG: hypothetical protein Unbinned5179contig1001_18 [Prokaryotic dsDNA virus sp.]|nr:MAG: hypothetical protein Unbinned5179contig1001_18 [Prokaryotic dsDNA virus sp.]|tara:strand:- start:2103 stop:3143 length:1041 start_codon:yes stop_codon:yes gene_type:complete